MKAVMLSITMKDSTLRSTGQPISESYEGLYNWQLLTRALSPRITQQQSLASLNAPGPLCYDKHATSADIQDLAPTLYVHKRGSD